MTEYSYYESHFEPLIPSEDVHGMSQHLLSACPVAHSDQDGGFWVFNRHADVMQVLQDPDVFESGRAAMIPRPPEGLGFLEMPPMDSNPPLHRQFRQLMNPYLTPDAVLRYETGIRAEIAALVDGFAEEGKCDLAERLAHVFPARITFAQLLSITDEDELENARKWVRIMTYGHHEPPEVQQEARESWIAWLHAFVARRREGERIDDIVDVILNETVDGRALSDEEILGALMILILGGFGTTADATANFVVRLSEEPGLEKLLRDDPSLIPAAIEESLRLEPPVTNTARICSAAARIDTAGMDAQDRVLVNFAAANRDSSVFENPDEFDLTRRLNRHLAFGGGPHRCIGSNLARLSLRVMAEELLARIEDIRVDGPTGRVSNLLAWRTVDTLPITYSPIAKESTMPINAGRIHAGDLD